MAHVGITQDTREMSPTTTEKRKARKRELDRMSQQKKRKNDRETISKLKAQVKALGQRSGDDNQTYNLILKREKDQEKIKRQLERVKNIEALVQASLNDLEEETSKTTAGTRQACKPGGSDLRKSFHQLSTPDLQDGSAFNANETYVPEPPVVNPSRSHLDAMTWDELTDGFHSKSPDSSRGSPEEYMNLQGVLTSHPSATNEDSRMPEVPSLSLPLEAQTTDWALQGTSTLNGQSSRHDDCQRCDTMWTVCDTAIVQGRDTLLYFGKSDNFDEGDAHIIITAITEGWDKAGKSQYWNTHWEALRQIDEICHASCGPVERMSSLYTLIRLFKYQRFLGDPLAAELPAFLRARPSQLYVPHASVVDHFIWPGFREHLVFDHKKYHNNTFSNDYANNLRFIWPYELRDTYMNNKMTRLYQFSSDFIERANDLRCYTMNAQFLTKYPEFQGDVPIFDPSPRMMSAPGVEKRKAILCHFPMPELDGGGEVMVEEVEEGS